MTLAFPLRPPESPAERDRLLMEMALREAEAAARADEVPIGCVVVLGNRILGRDRNRVEELVDPTAHAEMLALSQAFAAVGEKRLPEAELFCTLEPCVMCVGAVLHARLARVVFAARDHKFGGVCSLCRGFELEGANHRPEWVEGVESERSAELLREFFRSKRGS